MVAVISKKSDDIDDITLKKISVLAKELCYFLLEYISYDICSQNAKSVPWNFFEPIDDLNKKHAAVVKYNTTPGLIIDIWKIGGILLS